MEKHELENPIQNKMRIVREYTLLCTCYDISYPSPIFVCMCSWKKYIEERYTTWRGTHPHKNVRTYVSISFFYYYFFSCVFLLLCEGTCTGVYTGSLVRCHARRCTYRFFPFWSLILSFFSSLTVAASLFLPVISFLKHEVQELHSRKKCAQTPKTSLPLLFFPEHFSLPIVLWDDGCQVVKVDEWTHLWFYFYRWIVLWS